MFTAKDLHNKVKEANECPAIDFWIENTLVGKFKTSPNNVTVDTGLLRVNSWTRLGFESAMSERGFSVQYVSDQRDGDYYTVTYPPQGR